MIVECKAPRVKITQDAFNQIAKYNFKLRVDFLVVTNGMKHFCCAMDYKNNKITFLKEVPNYQMTYFFSVKKVSNEIKITNDIKMIANIIID